MGTKRDLKALERRRLRGVRLLRRGVTEAEVARMCEVSRNAVNLWAKQWASGGKSSLRAKRLGRPPTLDAAKRSELVRLLKRGALAAGYATGLWTLARVAEVISRRFGVRYTPHPRLAPARGLGVESATTRPPRARARRTGDPRLEAATLAGSKKTLPNKAG